MEHHVDGFSVQGEQRKEKCDRWLACANEGVTTIALSDGATACSHAAQAASIAVHEAAFFVTDHFQRLIAADEKNAAYSICSHVLGAITEEAVKKDIPLEEFGCTLLVFAYDSHTGQTLQFHLGDGGIVRLSNGQSTVLSPPSNRGAHMTDLITGENAYEKSRFHKGVVEEACTVFLLTDGCWSVRDAFQSTKQFEKLIRQYSPADDATCVSISFFSDKGNE